MTARQKFSRAGRVLRCGAVMCLLALSGCAGNGESDAKSPATETEVLDAYGAMWAEQTKAYRVASTRETDLWRYLAPAELRTVEADLARMSKERTVMRGDLGHEPEITTLTVGAQPNTATVRDCVDSSRWQILDTTTGWRLPPPADQEVRYVVTARMERGERWTVTEYTEDRTHGC
ncbi:secreted protein/lipoprotein [Streptomyces sp. NBC_01012]|uniref:secreted protein/lipoprotein n=1 Tax=Streptomyces sp. NBC_01012 TaxID=2903717 RepID=UPI0038648768|nr:secreted protein/lipoprotein [Streptomyces sp. NBC_01012]